MCQTCRRFARICDIVRCATPCCRDTPFSEAIWESRARNDSASTANLPSFTASTALYLGGLEPRTVLRASAKATVSLLDCHRFRARQELLRAHHNVSQESVDTPHSFQVSCKAGTYPVLQTTLNIACCLSFLGRAQGPTPAWGSLCLSLSLSLSVVQRMIFAETLLAPCPARPLNEDTPDSTTLV